MDKGNALCLGGKEIVIVLGGDQLQKLPAAGLRQFRIAKADERTDVKIICDLAKGKLTLESRDLHRIGHRSFLLIKVR